MNKRKPNFEALRIVAMLMVITLHYCFKSYITLPVWEDGYATAKNICLWLLPSFSMCAVNVYVLISGYFLVESEFKLRRLVDLFIQILEYSIVIAAILLITGVSDINNMHLYEWFELVFPIGTEGYWFMTAYVVMFILSPFLAAGAKSMKKEQLRILIVILVFLESFEKTIFPFAKLPIDHMGYDCVWFIVLFLIAAYIRLYGISLFDNSKVFPWIVYILSSLIIWATQVGFGRCYMDTGKGLFLGLAERSTDYNFLFCLTASLGLFFGFKNLEFNETSRLAELCRKLGPMTLGVYLLHEHFLVRYRWGIWLGVNPNGTVLDILLRLLVSLIVVFVAGIGVEALRLAVHRLVKKN